MFNKLTDYPIYVQLLAIPLVYFVAIAKIIIVIPIWIIAKVNKFMDSIK